MKKKWYLLIPAFFLGLPLIVVLYISMSYGYSLSESWQVFMATGKADTKFAPFGYSESKFNRIQTGMNGRQVFEIVDKPVERHDDDTVWVYSVPVGDAKYYHERTLVMERGVVTKIIKRFHTPETKDAK